MLNLDFRVLGLGFKVSCFGNKSRHPSGEMDDILNLIKHWLCPVKTHFPRQHTPPGRSITSITSFDDDEDDDDNYCGWNKSCTKG